jgi:hypothetical protein
MLWVKILRVSDFLRTQLMVQHLFLLECSQSYLAKFERAGKKGTNILTNAEQHGSLQALEVACHVAEPPLRDSNTHCTHGSRLV